MSIFQEASSTVFAKLADKNAINQNNLIICLTFIKGVMIGTYSYMFQDYTCTGFITEEEFNYSIEFAESLMRANGENRPISCFCAYSIDWASRMGIGSKNTTTDAIKAINAIERFLNEPLSVAFDGITPRLVLFNVEYSYLSLDTDAESKLRYAAKLNYIDIHGQSQTFSRRIIVDAPNTPVDGYRIIGSRCFSQYREQDIDGPFSSDFEVRFHRLAYQCLTPIWVLSTSFDERWGSAGTFTVIG